MLKIRRISAVVLAGLLVLMAIPTRGRADPGPRNVVWVAASDVTAVEHARARLDQAVRDDLIWIESYVIVERDARGRFQVKEDWQRKPATPLPPAVGASIVGLTAVLGGVVGLFFERGDDAGLGYITGSAAGPRPAKREWSDAPPRGPEGFADEVSRLERAVPPGQAALIAVIEERLPTEGIVVDVDKVRARQQLERELPVLKTAR